MAIRFTKDGRTILSGKDYDDLRRRKYEEQGGKCADCGREMRFRHMHLHHKAGRGMGGSKRDDTLEATKGVCWLCHGQRHGQI